MSTESDHPDRSRKSWQSEVGRSSSFLGLGIQLAGSMLVYVFAGYLLDRWLGTTPWLIVVGSLLGMVAFFIQLSRFARRLSEDSERRKRETD